MIIHSTLELPRQKSAGSGQRSGIGLCSTRGGAGGGGNTLDIYIPYTFWIKVL